MWLSQKGISDMETVKYMINICLFDLPIEKG